MNRMIIALTVICSASWALGSEVRWHTTGTTDATCPFAAQFDQLSGYPFARLVMSDGPVEVVVPLAISDEMHCEWVQFSQVPTPASPATFSVFGSFLCMGRLPLYVVTRSLSGVQQQCELH